MFELMEFSIVIDMPIQAFILALVGALVLAKMAVSWITFLAETFAFGGSSVSLDLLLSSRFVTHTFLDVCS